MSARKGFTLIEIIVVMMIMAILAAVAIPSYTKMMQQGAAKAAQNNLITIYSAEQSFYYANNYSYCTTTTPAAIPNCGNGLNNLNTNLPANITDPNNNNSDGYFSYNCTAFNGTSYQCTATGLGITLTLTGQPAQIVLPGSTNPPLNPTCTAGSPICPS